LQHLLTYLLSLLAPLGPSSGQNTPMGVHFTCIAIEDPSDLIISLSFPSTRFPLTLIHSH
jgi:hypothetical protein